MRRQGLQSTKEKPHDTDLEDNTKKNVLYCTTVEPNIDKEGNIYSDLCGSFPINSIRGNKYIYVMYMYDCNAILTTAMNNWGDKETIRAFTSIPEDLKSLVINPGFHFMDKKASTALEMTMSTMNIKYQLVPPNNHRANNEERAIKTFKNHFISGLFSADKNFQLQLWDKPLQQAKISLNLLSKSITLPHISAYTNIFREFILTKHL